MGLRDTFKKQHDGPPETAPDTNGEPPETRDPQPLSHEERERVLEKARGALPELDRTVEENVERLRELARSS